MGIASAGGDCRRFAREVASGRAESGDGAASFSAFLFFPLSEKASAPEVGPLSKPALASAAGTRLLCTAMRAAPPPIPEQWSTTICDTEGDWCGRKFASHRVSTTTRSGLAGVTHRRKGTCKPPSGGANQSAEAHHPAHAVALQMKFRKEKQANAYA